MTSRPQNPTRYHPFGVCSQLRAPLDITMLPWHMVHMASVAPPPGPTCFRTDFASILEASDLKITGFRVEGIANPAYRPFSLQDPPGTSKSLQKSTPGAPKETPRAPKGSPWSSQELPQRPQEPSAGHPQTPPGRPGGLRRRRGSLPGLILEPQGAILELFWSNFRSPGVSLGPRLWALGYRI